MAKPHMTPHPPFGAITTFRVVNVLSQIRRKIQNILEMWYTASALSQLSPRQLEDIGLSSEEIAKLRIRRYR